MRRLTPLRVLAVAVLAAGLGGCGGDGSSGSGKELAIGVIAPLSGPQAAAGREVVNGAKSAAEALNVRGGVIGVPVKVVEVDDRCTAEGAKDAVETLAREKNLGGVVGGVCPTPTANAARALGKKKIPFLVTAANSPAIVDAEKTPTSYLFVGTPYQESLAVAHWLALESKQFLATVSEKTPESEFLVNKLTYLTSPSPKLVSQQRVAPGEQDLTSVAKNLLAAKERPDIVYFAGSPETSGRLVAALREAGYKGTFVASARSRSPAFLAAAGPDGAQGAFVVSPARPEDLSNAKDWASAYRRTYGHPPTADAMESYDALRTLAQAVTQTGKVDHAQNSDQLFHLDLGFDTFLGGVQFANDHTIQADNHIIVVADKGAFGVENLLRSADG